MKLMPGRRSAIGAVLSVCALLILAVSEGTVAQTTAPDGMAFAQAGNEAAEAGDEARALAFYTQALQAGTLSQANQGLTYYNRGISHMELGRPEEAAQDFTTAITLNPNIDRVYLNRSVAFNQLGRYGEALEDLNQVLDTNPESESEIYNMRGMALTELDSFELAVADFNVALDRGAPPPGRTAFYFRNRGRAYFFNGQYADAAADFDRARSALDDFPYTPLWLYISAARAGNADAVELLRTSAGRYRPDVWPGPVAGMLLGDLSPLAAFEAALDNDPIVERGQLAEYFFYAAELSLIKGNTERAMDFFFSAMAQDMHRYDEHKGAEIELARIDPLN